MTKKLFAIFMALVLVCAITMVAFADNQVSGATVDGSMTNTVYLQIVTQAVPTTGDPVRRVHVNWSKTDGVATCTNAYTTYEWDTDSLSWTNGTVTPAVFEITTQPALSVTVTNQSSPGNDFTVTVTVDSTNNTLGSVLTDGTATPAAQAAEFAPTLLSNIGSDGRTGSFAFTLPVDSEKVIAQAVGQTSITYGLGATVSFSDTSSD